MTEEEKNHEESIVEETIENLIPGLGKVVKHLKNQSPEFQKRIDETDKEIRERLAKGESSQPKVSYNYSVRTLAGQQGRQSPQGMRSVKKAEKPKISEPIVDVFEEEDAIRIIAELPGIREEDIRVTKDDRKLTIEAEYGKKKYRKEIPLPYPAEESSRRYQNGILEIEMKKNGS